MTTEKWRTYDQAELEDFYHKFIDQHREAYNGRRFEDDPLAVLAGVAEANLVAIFYAIRQREEERANRPPFMSKLGDLLQKLVWSLQSGIMMKEATIDLDGITFKVIGSRLDYGDRPFDFKITIKEKV